MNVNAMPKHWPSTSTSDYDEVAEIAIDLLANAGYRADDKDEADEVVSEDLQTALMDVMFRAPRLRVMMDHFGQIGTQAIVNHKS